MPIDRIIRELIRLEDACAYLPPDEIAERVRAIRLLAIELRDNPKERG